MSLKYLNWYPLANGLVDFLKNYTYDDGTHLFEYLDSYDNLKLAVGAGISGQYPRIDIIFGEERSIDLPNNMSGATVQLWLDVYVSGADTDSEDKNNMLYMQLYKVEKEIMNLIQIYAKMMQRQIGFAIKTELVGVLSDGSENAPVSAQNRIVLDFTWQK